MPVAGFRVVGVERAANLAFKRLCAKTFLQKASWLPAWSSGESVQGRSPHHQNGDADPLQDSYPVQITRPQPFGPDTLVYKVGSKVFAILPLDADPATINLKCQPDRAERLRAEYAGVMPGYHMNKRHWNTVVLDGDVPERLVEEMIRHSYELVVNALPRAVREGLGK